MNAQNSSVPPKKIEPKLLIVMMLFPLFMAIAYPLSFMGAFHNPAPHQMPVAIIQTTDNAQQIAQGLEAEAEDAVEVSTVQDVETAQEKVLRLEERAAYDPATGDLYVASAGGPLATNAAQSIFSEVAKQSHTELHVQNLKKPAESDSLGTAYMYGVMGAIIAGYIASTIINALGKNTKLWTKLAILLGFAVLAGITGTAILYGFYGIYTEHLVPVALTFAAEFFAVSLFQLGAASLLGLASSLLGIVLFVILGNPALGVAITSDMMPGFFSFLHTLLPSGAAGDLTKRTLYFDHVGIGPDLLNLVLWAILGSAMLWMGSLKTPEKGTELIDYSAEHPSEKEPLLTAYEEASEENMKKDSDGHNPLPDTVERSREQAPHTNLPETEKDENDLR
ncbi:ABC transporter permease [Rothia terrae]|uniref:ABC transporter permease n=1 Tax=Rothia terrae TaxID=396015 RepID=UPI001445BECC|nr:ABC transporter permease [Rothia terrae]NKZ33646.1 ABC transporter permease [Rothia terrae]